MEISLTPKSREGKWGVGLTAAYVVFMILKFLLPLPLPSPFIAIFGLSGFAAAAYALAKRDLAVLLLPSILFGLVIIFWITAELIYPH